MFAEAKGNGFDVKAIRQQIIKMRKMDAAKHKEEETVLDTYMHALGVQMSLEPGQVTRKAQSEPDEAEEKLSPSR